METSEIILSGDTAGIEWRLPVLRFKGSDPKVPKVYIQAALHANELPGTALIHFLCEMLREAEKAGQILGDITIVPHANPIGAAQSHFGELQGRFDLGTRTNFNRDFPLISVRERDGLVENLDQYGVVDRLKRQLMHMALGCDLVIDLHCDDESLQYAYIDDAFWPEAADLASALDMEAVLLSDGESSAFEEAVGYAWKHEVAGEKKVLLPGKLSVTVELRGGRDVYPEMAKTDAAGLFNVPRQPRRDRHAGDARPVHGTCGAARQYRDDPRARSRHGAVSSQYRREGRRRRIAGDDHHPPGHGRRHRRGPRPAGRPDRYPQLGAAGAPACRPDEDCLRERQQGGAQARSPRELSGRTE
jgi:predicted deacylase